MRELLPGTGDRTDLHGFYAADWLEQGGVRGNFIAAADGAIAVSGVSRGLQTAGDNRVFGTLRDLADVVVVGSGTAVAEDYAAVTVTPEREAARARYGLAAALPLAIVSRSLRLDPASALFTGAARTMVITSAAADAVARARLADVADVLLCGQDGIDARTARAALAERGLRRVLHEGGPTVFAAWVAEGAVDELCLSLSPALAGPGAGRVTAGKQWPDAPRRLVLAGLLEEDGALFCRYRL